MQSTYDLRKISLSFGNHLNKQLSMTLSVRPHFIIKSTILTLHYNFFD